MGNTDRLDPELGSPKPRTSERESVARRTESLLQVRVGFYGDSNPVRK